MELSKRELNKLFHRKVYYDYKHSNLTQNEISEKYKISLSTVNRVIRKYREGNISFIGRQGNRKTNDVKPIKKEIVNEDVIYYGVNVYKTLGNYVLEF